MKYCIAILLSHVGAISKKECTSIQNKEDDSALVAAFLRVNELLKRGSRGVSVKSLNLNDRQLQKLISTYESQDWTVKRDTYSDFRDSWDTLEFI
jgi:hypothetical protein